MPQYHCFRTGEGSKSLRGQNDQRGGFLLTPAFREELITSQGRQRYAPDLPDISIDVISLLIPEQQKTADQRRVDNQAADR